MSENLMDGIFSEMNRVRELIKEYEHPSLEGAGALAAAIMRSNIQAAEDSIRSGDVVAMLKAYKFLKQYES